MRQKLIAYINELFRGAEATEQNAELKEQILASALSRYDIFVLEGGEEQAAYDAAAAEALERSAAIVRPGASSPAAPAAPRPAPAPSQPAKKQDKNLSEWGVIAIVIAVLAAIGVFLLVSRVVGLLFSGPKDAGQSGGFGSSRYSAQSDDTLRADIRQIEINWVGGSVTLLPGADGVEFYEDYDGKASCQLRYSVSDSGVLTIDACKASLFQNISLPDKHLTVLVPDGIDSIQASVVSAELHAEELSVPVMVLSSVSGGIVYDSVSEKLACNTVSGDVSVRFRALPESVDLETISGQMTLTLPAGSSYTLDWVSISGKCDESAFVRGDRGSCHVGAETVSGDLKLLSENS